MNILLARFITVFAAVLIVFGVAGSAAAQRPNEKQTRDLVRSLNSQIDNFSYTLDMELRGDSDQSLVDATTSLQDLEMAMTTLDQNLLQRRENRDDINRVVDAARAVDTALAQTQQNQKIQREWEAIKTNIGRLSGGYGITPNWNGRSANYPSNGNGSGSYPSPRNNYPQNRNYPQDRSVGRLPGNSGPPVISARSTGTVSSSALTGTYKLDTSRSENADQIITETNVGGADRQDLQKKLQAPDQLAIYVRGSEVTLASSLASPISFSADGSEKTETDTAGRSIRLRATLKGDELTVSSLGGDSDYTVIFAPMDGGRSLKVTRRITTSYLNQTVFADTVYTKTDAVAGLGINAGDQQDTAGGWSSNDGSTNGGPVISNGQTGQFIVPNGTILVAQLDNNIDTKVSQNNDRFKMTVQSPLDYRGAVIEGHITGVGRSGRVSGSSNITFNFDTITLRDGKTYDFAGFLQSIKDQNGKSVAVDAEGTAKGGSQTRETVKRGGIGAGLGAVIGAITGGGTGAAVGAIIGGSVGAGSVVVQGRDDVQLMKGSTITVQASSPIRDDRPSEE